MGNISPKEMAAACQEHFIITNSSGVNAHGSPQETPYKYCLLDLEIVASDGDAAASQILHLEVFNQVPFLEGSLFSQATGVDIEVHGGLLFEEQLYADSFGDFDAVDAKL